MFFKIFHGLKNYQILFLYFLKSDGNEMISLLLDKILLEY